MSKQPTKPQPKPRPQPRKVPLRKDSPTPTRKAPDWGGRPPLKK